MIDNQFKAEKLAKELISFGMATSFILIPQFQPIDIRLFLFGTAIPQFQPLKKQLPPVYPLSHKTMVHITVFNR